MSKAGMLSSGRTLRFESLEERTVLNGTALVGHSGGTLFIDGDNAANTIVVQQTGGNLNSGATIKVTGAATKLFNEDTGKTGTTFTFTNVFSFDFSLNGGNDVLSVVNTALPGPVGIFMGDGNDVLTVTNLLSQGRGVESEPAFIAELGSGNNVATFANILVLGNIEVDGGNDKDVVTLANVSAGTPGSQNSIFVDLQGGSHNTLTVANSRAAFGEFLDDGTGGQITGAHNHFDAQLIEGFALRIGDLKHNT